jgi:hypothetical protein
VADKPKINKFLETLQFKTGAEEEEDGEEYDEEQEESGEL